MSLEHEFYLISEDEYTSKGSDYGNYTLSKDCNEILTIHDDVIQYIFDTFRWIPSINPGKHDEKGFGINNYGITLFNKDGARVLGNIAKSWADLFLNSPSTMKLTGNYYWGGDKKAENGEYEILELDRDLIAEKFRKLQSFAQKVLMENSYIIHFGI